MSRGLGGCLIWGVVALVLVLALCVAPLTMWRVSRQGGETAAVATPASSGAPTVTPTAEIPALGAFPPGFTPVPTAEGSATGGPTPTSRPAGTSPNGNPTTPGWGLWTATPPPAAAPVPGPTLVIDSRAVPPPGYTPPPPPPPGGGVYPCPPGNIPWYGPWLIHGKYMWWHGGAWHPSPCGGGGWWIVPTPTRPPDALPIGVQPGYRCADGTFIPRGQGNWQWPLGRYVIDGETITDRLGGPANRPTVHTGCKPVP